MEQTLKQSKSLNLLHECTPCNVVVTEEGYYDYSGCHFINNDHLGYNEKKDVIYVKDEPTDIIKLQNSYKEECDIKNIIKKSAMLGVSLEASDSDSYGDTTVISASMNERNAQALANAQLIESSYKKLPKEITGGLSVGEFIAALGSSDVMDFVKSKMKEETSNEK